MSAMLLWMLACATPPSACDPPGTGVESPRAAGCFVLHGGRLLLVQQNDGRWSIPGGYVERGEDSATAAVRETWEEARVRVTAQQPVCAVAAKRFVAHRCDLAPEELPPAPFADGKETRDARFLDRAEIEALEDKQLRFPAQKAAYLRALAR